MEEKYPRFGKKLGTNFPGSPNLIDFAAFSHAMGNWWGNPCISHVMKYTIGWESNGKKASILWEKYEYQFLRFSKYDGFCRIFPGTKFPDFSNSMMKYTARWKSNEKKHQSYGKSMRINFPGLPHLMGFADFSNALGN